MLFRILKIGIASLFMIGIVIFFLLQNIKYALDNKLPETPNEQWLNFFRDKLFYDKSLISNENNEGHIYDDGMIFESKRHTSYLFSPTHKIYEYYYDRMDHDEEDKYAYKKVNPNSYLEEIGKPKTYNLPEIKLIDGEMTVKTFANESTWSTLQENKDSFAVSNIRSIRVIRANEDAFLMTVSEEKDEMIQQYLLFMTQDLSDMHLIENEDEAINKFLKTESFSLYHSLFPPIDDEKVYLNYYTDNQVIDTKHKKLITIDDEDYLSDDGKYVYLKGGNDGIPTNKGLAEGEQQIQTLADYLAGNHSDYMTFDLNYKAVKNASEIGGIGTTVSDNDRNVVYFNDEFIVIHVSYDAIFFGKASSTNIVIDFHEDEKNPMIYVYDLRAS